MLKPKQAFLLHGGNDTWPAEKGILAVSLADLMARLVKD